MYWSKGVYCKLTLVLVPVPVPVAVEVEVEVTRDAAHHDRSSDSGLNPRSKARHRTGIEWLV